MTDPKKPAPLSGYERVKRHRQKLAAAGVQTYPNSPIPPDAAQALDTLLAAGYAPSTTAAISRALVEAASIMTKRKMKVYESNEKFVPVSLVHPEDVRDPWRGRVGKEQYMNLPTAREAAVRLVADWSFVYRPDSDPSYRVTIPAGSRVWLQERGDIMSPNLIGVELP